MIAIKFILNYISCLKFNLRKKVIQTSLICSVLCVASCEDFVELDSPSFEVSSDLVFENFNIAESATLGIYTSLQDIPLFNGGIFGLSTLLSVQSDVIEEKRQFWGGYTDFVENRLTPENTTVSGIWRGLYKAVFNANTVIEGVTNSSGLSETEKNQLLGEALFARSFANFYLVNLFGDVPYVTATDKDINNSIGKTQVDEIYRNIILDLLKAKDLLGESYLSVNRTRPNKSVVSAFLARVYLYNEEWEKAEDESTLVIENTGLYTFETNTENVFLKDSPSTIWQFSAGQVGGNTGMSTAYNLGFSIISFSDTQLAAFEANDNRLQNWTIQLLNFSTFTNDTAPFKYKAANNAGGTTTELNKILRLGEQYLIRAEARAQLNNASGAQSDLNQTRNRAGLDDTVAASTIDLLDAIAQERRVELFTEFGHRWFDLKRTGKADAILSLVPYKAGTWDATDVLYPIPLADLLANENLKPQNPGY